MKTETVIAGSAVVAPKSGRIIGISHRIKRKKDHEARPTLVAIMDESGAVKSFELATEQEELDFLNHQCAVKWRPVNPKEDIAGVMKSLEHQVIFRAAKAEDALVERHPSQCRYEMKRPKGMAAASSIKELVEVATDIPIEWIGIRTGDTVAMALGGSGDYFSFALSRKLSTMNGMVLRVPPFKLKECRADAPKDHDAMLLASMAAKSHEDFYETHVRDRGIIRLRNQYRGWMDTMKARIACEQRLFGRHIGLTFCSESGGFPEGSIEKAFAARKATDPILQALLAEEARAEKELEKAVYALDIWKKVFEPIPGVGPKIAARIVNAVIDIRRFKTAPQFVKFLGVHVNPTQPRHLQFPRRRNGQIANWHPDGRQALFLLSDQFNRQAKKGTKWGNYLIKTKAALRKRHPEVVVEDGKKRYTNGHIHKMAVWRTLTRFAEWLHANWWKLERSAAEAGSKE